MGRNGKEWEHDKEKVTKLVASSLVARRIAAAQRRDKEDILKASKPNEYTIRSCKEVLKMLVKRDIDEFDNEPDKLNVQNGVLDLRTGERVPHKSHHHFTYCIPISFNTDADMSKWVEYLGNVVRGGEDTCSGDIVQYVHNQARW